MAGSGEGHLACITFVDAQVGRVLDALDASAHGNNTWVVLLSDHGFHLGEKQKWGKDTGWQRATQVPLLIVPPAAAAQTAGPHVGAAFATNVACASPVSLIDLYPTLVDVCGLEPAAYRSTSDSGRALELDGESLRAHLTSPGSRRNRLVISTFDGGNHTMSSTHWHYIRYSDGGEELYHRGRDPHEWHNLAGDPKHAGEIVRFAQARPLQLLPVHPRATANATLFAEGVSVHATPWPSG